ncbi:MAG TPA: wax ester/triacylglycerol synthase family O-acyltransferase [Burkholderiaceae bacterium]|nr:wax ester/triacylglycerol synthase family O-acyltransferase [Burkholderiaceae bacterium]
MKTLSSLDASFLYLETPEMPMHVGALHVFELPAGYKGRYVRDLRKHIAARLPIVPALRRKLWWMPLNMANPAWVDAEPDLEQHIVEIKLPKSARVGDGMAALEAQVAALHPVLLDRKKPLWKFHIFEGLAPSANGRKRVAMYSQLHHAAVDGQAAVALANAILDLTPEPRAIELKASPREKKFRLSMGESLRGALASQFQQVANIVKELPDTLGTLGGAAGGALQSTLANSALLGGKGGSGNLALAPKTPFNVSITPGRAFAAVSLPLAELKAIGKAHDATINDMVMMVVSTALRRYLGKRHALPKKSLIAAVPISLRKTGDTTSDNQASMSLISLGTHIADPMKRLAHIRAASAAMKSTLGSVKSILPTDFPSLGLPWLMEAAASLYGRAKVAERIPQVANVAISNVPGPPMPLYLAGARMLTNYPTSIIVHGMALNITVQSYAGALDFGMIADAKAMPDVKAFAQAVEIAFDDLRALPLPHEQRDDDAPAALVGRAVRSVRSKVGDAVKGAVGGAMTSAVNQVVRGALRAATGATRRAASAARRTATPAEKAAPAKRSRGAKTGGRAAPRARRAA